MTQQVMMAMRLIEGFIGLMMGRRVQVNWNDRASVTHDGAINLPRPKTGDAAEVALLTRLGTHEAGHLKHTEAGSGDRLTAQEHAMFNALEDPRMERDQSQTYPGAKVILARGLDEMLPSIAEKVEERIQTDPGYALSVDVLLRGYLLMAPNAPMLRHAPDILKKVAPALSPDEREAVDASLGELVAARGSREAEEIAKRLLARLAPPKAAEPPPPEPEEGAEKSAPDADAAPDQAEEPQAEPESTDKDRAEANDAEESLSDGSQPQQPQTGDSQEQEAGTDGAQGGAEDAEQNAGQAEAADGSDQSGSDGSESADPSPGNETAEGSQGQPDPSSGSDGSQPGAGQEQTTADAGAPGGDASQQGGSPSEATAEDDDATEKSETAGADAQHGPEAQAEVTAQEQAWQPSEPAGPKVPNEPVDLGSLIREAIVQRYGPSEPADDATGEAAEPLTDQELERMRAVLASAAEGGDLEQLLETSLIALAATPANDDAFDGEPSDGAGMALGGKIGESNIAQSRLQGVQARLVTVLQRELQDRKRKPTRAAHAGGRIIPTRMWRLSTLGDTKVFARSREASGIDAAATILVDSSYSMKDVLHEALQVAMGFSLALQRLSVKTRVVRFPGAETVVTETLQAFGESPRACVDRCAHLVAAGGTPVGTATAIELPVLLAQKRLKNVLVIVTDDDPGDPEVLVAAIEKAVADDVLVVGVGIGCDIRHWIPNSVSVRTVNDLPEALTRLFRENISTKLAA